MKNVEHIGDRINVVRCKDCIQNPYASNRIPQECTWICSRLGIRVKDDWFCADGERREYGENSDTKRE